MTSDPKTNFLTRSLSSSYLHLGKASDAMKTSLALEGDRTASDGALTASSNELFVQTLSLPVSSLSAAKKSARILIERLSPIPVRDIVWDLVGPLEKRGEKHVYKLAILKAQDLTVFSQEGVAKAYVKAPSGEVFEFIDDEGFKNLGKKIAKWVILGTISYAAILWSLSQWGQEFTKTANQFNQNSTTESRISAQTKTDTEITETELALIDSFENKTVTSRYIKELADISASLGEKDWLSSIENSAQKLQLSGYAEEPADIVRKLGDALPNARINLGSITTDRVTGLNRFSIIVTKPTEKTETFR